MEKTKFANLSPEEISEIKTLEDKLEVTLLAYDHFAIQEQPQQQNNSNIINPS